MNRTRKSDNLYKVVKAQRKDKKVVDSQIIMLLHPDLRSHDRVHIQKFTREKFRRGLQKEFGEIPYPVSPKIGPYEINDPLYGSKNYYWCSCGMSKNQPFCDSSHQGTDFKPLKFSLDTPQTKMFLCGCKLTQKAPFCDGKTCICIVKDFNKEANVEPASAVVEPTED